MSGRDRMVVGIMTTCAINAYHHYKVMSYTLAHGEVNSIKHYEINFVSDLRQDGGFLQILRFHPPVKLTTTI